MPAPDADHSGNDHGLARLDSLGDMAELRARAEEAIAGLDVDPRAEASQEGTDASNSVWITVNTSGAVLGVRISRHWTGRLPAERLGEAIFEAYTQAQEKRGAVAMLAATRPRASGGSGDGSVETNDAETYDPGMPDIHDPRWLRWVWQSIDEAGLRLHDMLAGGRADAERIVPGPNGHVRMRVQGRRVTAVLVDRPGLAERNPDAVAADVRATFEAVRTSAQ